jgi:3-deoxy-D-manno-octulosonic-acid transferase
MQAYYHLASVAWLGGSFAPFGGQNLIEAAACGCPVVMGPHTFNFADAAEIALQSGAARRVPDIASCWSISHDWLINATARDSSIQGCRSFLAEKRGAAKSCLEFLGLLTRC